MAYRELTVSEYAAYMGIPVDTVRSRIRAGKIKTVEITRDNKKVMGIQIPLEVFDSEETVSSTVSDSENNSWVNSPQLSNNNYPLLEKLLTELTVKTEELGVYKERARQAEHWESQVKLLTDSQHSSRKEWAEKEGMYLQRINELQEQLKQSETVKPEEPHPWWRFW